MPTKKTKKRFEPTEWSESLNFALELINLNTPPGEKKYSVYKLAKDADINQPTVARILSGEIRKPSAEFVGKINEALKKKLDSVTMANPKPAHTNSAKYMPAPPITKCIEEPEPPPSFSAHSNAQQCEHSMPDKDLSIEINTERLTQALIELDRDIQNWNNLSTKRRALLITAYYKDLEK